MSVSTSKDPISNQSGILRFFSECESKFRFLELHHNFSYMNGLQELKDHRKIIKPYDENSLLDDNTLAITRYERGNIVIEITFSYPFGHTECLIFYDPILRFSLQDLLMAARKTITTEDMTLKDAPRTLIHLAEDLRTHVETLLNPTQKMLDRALSIRHTRIEEVVRKNFMQNLKTRVNSAARAFTEKNYRQVIILLTPYKKYLEPTEAKKLEIAKKRLIP